MSATDMRVSVDVQGLPLFKALVRVARIAKLVDEHAYITWREREELHEALEELERLSVPDPRQPQ